jgi:hypothetical protein
MPPVNIDERPLPAYVMMEQHWYRRNLARARLGTYVLEVLVLLFGAAIAVSAALHFAAWLTSLLGAAVAVFAGLRSLFGWKENRRARATAYVDIQAEIARYERGAAPYDSGDAKLDGDLLQETVIAVVKAETAAWVKQNASVAET